MDLWGFSTGAAITAELLRKKAFRSQVANAVLICPPSCVDRKMTHIPIFNQDIPVSPKQFITELLDSTLANLTDTAKRNVSNREDFEYTADHRRRMTRTYNALRAKTLKRTDWWVEDKDMQVKEGGKITVAIYKGDHMTEAIKVADKIRANPNLDVQEFAGAHERCLFDPEPLLKAVV